MNRFRMDPLLPESVRYLVLKGGQDARVADILRHVDPQAPLEGAHFVGVRKVEGSPVGQLFTRDLMAGTLLLWVTFFMSLLVYYLLTSWLPTLLKTAGQTCTCIRWFWPVGKGGSCWRPSRTRPWLPCAVVKSERSNADHWIREAALALGSIRTWISTLPLSKLDTSAGSMR